MTPEGWALLWIGGINVVWACIYVGVLVFALRTDTEGSHRGRRTSDPEPEPPRTPGPPGDGHPVGRVRRRRLRGAELQAARRGGTTYYPRVYR
jgi:hypothetical protein